MDIIQTSSEVTETETPQPKAESVSDGTPSTAAPAPEGILEQEIMH